MIYLDYAATTPLCPSAKEAWLKASDQFFANTNSLHEPGDRAGQLLSNSRAAIALTLQAKPEQIYFTSGGTEANYLALSSLHKKNPGTHLLTTKVEHPSVTSFFQQKEKEGIVVTYADVDNEGRVSVSEVVNLCRRKNISLISIQMVNSETGVVQPIAEIAEQLRDSPVSIHTDAVQAFGKFPISIENLAVDALSISAHKIQGPKGIGAVFLRSKKIWQSVFPLTTHENGFRPGTPDTPSAAAFAAAANYFISEAKNNNAWEKRSFFLNELSVLNKIMTIEGSSRQNHQSPYIIGAGFAGVQGQYLLASLDRYGICISTGSACRQGEWDASPMMHALYSSEDIRNRFVRFSFSPSTTVKELQTAAKSVVKIVSAARR